MDRQFVPEGYWFSELGLRNVFENEATAQFNHRILAYILMVLALFAGWRHPRMAGGWFKWLAAIVCAQASLGVYTLIMGAPLWLGLAHQGLGVALVITAIVVLWRCSAPQSLRRCRGGLNDSFQACVSYARAGVVVKSRRGE